MSFKLPTVQFMKTHVSTWLDEYGRLWLFQQSFKPTPMIKDLLQTIDGHLVFMYAKNASEPIRIGDTIQLTRDKEHLEIEIEKVLESRASRSGFKNVFIISV